MIIARDIHTVNGIIPSTKLGLTLMHEHVFCRVNPKYIDKAKSFLKEQLDVLDKLNVRTIVDLTTYVLPDVYVDVICQTKINVICCAGYYVIEKVPSSYRSLSKEDLRDKLANKFRYGMGNFKIKPSIIKVASKYRTISAFEKNALRASALVQNMCNVPIATHAIRGGRKQLEIMLDEGANPKKIFLSHMEMELKGKQPLTFNQLLDDILWILSQGAYIFLGDFSVADTEYRKNIIKILQICCEKGYEDQFFISTDCYWSVRKDKVLVRGSNANNKTPRTYDYPFNLTVPVLKQNGFSRDVLIKIFKENPKNFFSTII